MAKSITKQIANFLSLFPESITSELVPENKIDAEHRNLLHISRDPNLGMMYPRICERQMKSEDRTIPRVVGAPTILGCVSGYGTIIDDQYIHKKAKKINDVWLNGYYIYDIDYDWRFRPSDKLVPHQKSSGEVWLLGYNEDNKNYKPSKIGKFFIISILQDFTDSLAGSNFTSEVRIYVEINSSEPIHLSKNIQLNKGYWEIKIPFRTELNSESISWEKDKDIFHKEIDAGEFYLKKKLNANLLGYTDVNPFQF